MAVVVNLTTGDLKGKVFSCSGLRYGVIDCHFFSLRGIDDRNILPDKLGITYENNLVRVFVGCAARCVCWRGVYL
jgi:hypothetical protein